jgi:hypothetical protein
MRGRSEERVMAGERLVSTTGLSHRVSRVMLMSAGGTSLAEAAVEAVALLPLACPPVALLEACSAAAPPAPGSMIEVNADYSWV